jgi:4-hydroxyacetophenone monooxygenase
MGNSVPNFPNFYFATGPNVALGSMSFVYIIEGQVNYITQCITAAGRTRLLNVREDITDTYNQKIQQALGDETIWFAGCNNWFLNSKGHCEVNFPWRGSYFRRLLKLNLDNYEVIDKPV